MCGVTRLNRVFEMIEIEHRQNRHSWGNEREYEIMVWTYWEKNNDQIIKKNIGKEYRARIRSKEKWIQVIKKGTRFCG